MKTKTNIGWTPIGNLIKSKVKLLAIVALAGSMATSAFAQNIVANGSFVVNATSFTNFPGYIGGNAAISSWSASQPGGEGLNGVGTVTDVFGPSDAGGKTYAFIQNPANLTQALSGSYVAGRTYQLDFDVAGRAGDPSASFRIQIGDNSSVHFTTQVGGVDVLTANTSQFVHYTYTFTAPASFDGPPSIQIYNFTSGATVDFANVSLVVATGNLIFNGDFTADAANFVTFPGLAGYGSNPFKIDDWFSIVQAGNVGLNGAGTITGIFGPANDGGLTYAFIQGGVRGLAQNIIGLTPNTDYQLTFKVAARSGNTNVVFRVQIGDASATYVTTQVGGSDVLTGNPNKFVSYTYTFTTPASFNGGPSIQLYNLTGGDNTIDFANISLVALIPAAPAIATQPLPATRYVGASAMFSPSVTGYPTPSYQWKKNGGNIIGATNQTLLVTNVQMIDSGSSYILTATNSYGGTNTVAVTLTVLPQPTSSAYAVAVLGQNPMGYWRFSDGGGTNAYDYVGGNNAYDTNYMNNGNGSTGNPAILGAGPQPSAFTGFETTNTAPFLDGLSQGYSSSVGLFNNRSNFTIMGWFNIDPSQYPIVTDPFSHPQGRASLFGQEWAAEISIYQGTNLYFYATGISATIFANTNLVPGVWNFVAAVSDATANTTTLYLNGAVVGTASACPGTVNPYLFSIGKNVSYYPSGGYDNAFFPGSLDEVAAFDHPLSSSQIQALYQTAVAIANVPPTNVVARVANISGTNNLILSGAGGSGSSYTVLTTTNLTKPLANWTTNATGLPFGAGGSVNYTNPINPATPQLFYRIRVP